MGNSVMALGMFDGMHMGHRILMGEAAAYAREHSCVSYAYSFSNHPLSLISPHFAPPMLLTDVERVRAIKHTGIDSIIFEHFDDKLMNMQPADFISMLKQRYGMRCAVVGFNYTFGKSGVGTTEYLLENTSKLGIDVIAIPPVMYKGEVVSSTRIRELIISGNVEDANAMLMSRYTLTAHVVKNKGNGEKTGFRTANTDNVEGKTLPMDGVYETRAVISNTEYKSLTNIGSNPTFNGEKRTIETHILDFADEIYNEKLSVEFVRRLRDCVKFDSIDALKKQIACDAARVRGEY